MSLNFDWFNEVIGWLKSVSAEKSVQLTNKQLHTITEQEAAEEKKMPQKYLSFGLCHFVWVTWRWTITWHLSFSGWFVRCAVFFLRLLLCSALSLSLRSRIVIENCELCEQEALVFYMSGAGNSAVALQLIHKTAANKCQNSVYTADNMHHFLLLFYVFFCACVCNMRA